MLKNVLNYNISNETYESILKATLLLVLSVSGNFLAETLGCQSQKVLENMFAKHILIFFMIYFTIDFTQRDQNIINPLVNVLKALLVWILFHLFTHMNIIPTFIVSAILMVLFFISNYRHYIDKKIKQDKKNKNLENLDYSLKLSQKILFVIMILIIIIGCISYYLEKRREFGRGFKILKFIFGVKKCKGYTPKSAKIL